MREFVDPERVPLLTLVCVILAGVIIIGLLIDWFRRSAHIAPPRRLRTHVTTTPAMSIGKTAAWNKRLSQLHEIDRGAPEGGYGSSCRLVYPEDQS